MRTIVTSLALLALLSACGSLPAPPAQPYPSSGAPLRAWLLPPGPSGLGGVLSFQINRPAHVAIFEIIPGRGVGMIYPSFTGDLGYLSAGYHTTFRSMASHRWGYLPSLVYSSASQQPRFLFLVASEAPLRISNFAASPMALRGTMGLRHFTAWNPYAAMDELTQMILPVQSWGDWTTDLYVDWPEPSRMVQQPRYVVLVCRDGRRLLVPAGYGFTGCPGEVAAVVGSGREPSDPEEGVEVPSRRRPEPVAEGAQPGDAPRTRPAVAEDEPGQPRPVEREPRGRGPVEAPERERVRPLPVREVEPSRERGPRAEPARGEPRAGPRSEPRPAPSAEPRRTEPRPAPPPRPASEPRAEPRRDPPAPPSSSPAPTLERERPSRPSEPSAEA